MCAQFTVKANKDDFDSLGIVVPDSLNEIDERFLPSKVAPVVVKSNAELKLTGMRFSLIPSWSKEPKVKFATHNARIETVLEKPTWRKPFESQHCVVPMTGFFESVYEGEKAGNVIQFHDPEKSILLAAGIFDHWVNPENKKDNFYSFSILTTEPTKYILENGHDRSPLFLSSTDAKEWLRLIGNPKDQLQFLSDRTLRPNLTVTIDRPLKAGWEKRK